MGLYKELISKGKELADRSDLSDQNGCDRPVVSNASYYNGNYNP